MKQKEKASQGSTRGTKRLTCPGCATCYPTHAQPAIESSQFQGVREERESDRERWVIGVTATTRRDNNSGGVNFKHHHQKYRFLYFTTLLFLTLTLILILILTIQTHYLTLVLTLTHLPHTFLEPTKPLNLSPRQSYILQNPNRQSLYLSFFVSFLMVYSGNLQRF